MVLLPAIRIVHCGDMHLDASFIGAGLGDAAARRRAEERKDAFARIVRLVREEGADLFLIAGDLFEHDYVRKATVQFVIDLLQQELAGVPVFIAPGNHDPLTRDSYYATLRWPANVTIFGPRWERVELPGLGAAVHGWGFDRPHVKDRHLAALRLPPSDQVQIVLLHGSDELVPADEGVYLPLNRAECLACGADYIALGHFHSHHVVAERRGPLAVYPGTPESLSFGQAGPGGVLAGTVGKGGNALRLVSVGRREHRTLAVDISGAATPEAAAGAVLAVVPEPDRRRHLYRITLTGAVDPDLELDPAGLAERLSDSFHHLEVRDATEPALDLDALAGEQSLRGHFVRALRDELARAPAGREAEIRLALRYGLRALAGGP